MSTPDQLDTLLSAWHAARAAGRDPPAEELCRDCPDLAPKLAERIALLKQVSGLGKDPGETVTNAPAATAPLPTRIGEYHILTRLGQGGMGAVYWAEDDRLRRPTAVKVLRPELAARPDMRERFLREARAAAAVEHESLVPIWHIGEDHGVPYIAMPLLRGESLADRIARDGRLPPTAVAQVGRDVAAGLSAAHRAGLIHRDIKPANIWLERKDAEDADPAPAFPRARILDFGLARLDDGEDPQLTGTGDVLGTPAYMAPEQARGQDVDPRADLFGLGCVLYHAATGRPPFRARTVMETLLAVAQEHPPDPRTLAPDLPAALAALINRLMAKDRADRPATAADVLRALKTLDAPDTPTLTIPAAPVVPVPLPVPVPDGACVLDSRFPMSPGRTDGGDAGKGKTGKAIGHGHGQGHEKPRAGAGVPPPLPAVPVPVPDRASRRPRRRPPWLIIGVLAVSLLIAIILAVVARRKPPDAPPDSEPVTPPGTYADLNPARIPGAERYPWQSTDLVAVVGGHAGLVGPVTDATHVAISPDSKWLAWSGPDGVRVWDTDTLRLRFHDPHSPPAAPGFSADGKVLAVGSFRPVFGTFGARLIDLAGPDVRLIRPIAFGPSAPVTALALSRDGKLVATGTANGGIDVWDADAGPKSDPKYAAQAETGHPVRQLAFAGQDRRLIALVRDDRARGASVRGWGLGERAVALFTIKADADVRRVGVMPDGNRVVVPIPGATDSELTVWRVGGGEKVRPGPIYTTKVARGCRGVEVLRDEPNLPVPGAKVQFWQIWLGHDDTAGVWALDIAPKKVHGLVPVRDLPAGTLAVSPDLSRIVSRTADGRLAVQTADGRAVATGPVPPADPDHPPVLIGNRLLTFRPTPQAWDVRDGQFVPAGEVKSAGGPAAGSPAVAPGGGAFAWRGPGGAVHVYAAGTFRRTVLQSSSAAVAFVWADSRTIRTAHRDGAVLSWDLGRDPPTSAPAGKVPDAIRTADFALDPGLPAAYAQADDRSVKRYSLADPTAAAVEVCKGAGPRVWPSPTGARLATDDVPGLAVWDARTGVRRTVIALPARPSAVQWAEDERHLLVTMDGLMYVLRLAE